MSPRPGIPPPPLTMERASVPRSPLAEDLRRRVRERGVRAPERLRLLELLEGEDAAERLAGEVRRRLADVERAERDLRAEAGLP